MTKLQEYWDEQAGAWAAFARTEGHDVAHGRLNFPAFLRLLPPPGRATLDVGCGEGRVGAELERRGYRVIGVDSSPRMVELARERHEAVVADATALPFDDASFDLAIAYMSLMNMDNLEAALPEIARVLEPGGRFCFAVTHPFATAGAFESREPGAPYIVTGSYFEGPDRVWESDRDGIVFGFVDRVIPFERYTRALEGAGLLIEALREPAPSPDFVADAPSMGRHLRIPLFLHVRALKQ
jgi:SAM-dependent methyltransferase